MHYTNKEYIIYSRYYKVHYCSFNKQWRMVTDVVGNSEKDLIRYIANGFHFSFWSELEKLSDEKIENYNENNRLNYEYFDSEGRRIDPYPCKKDAFEYYLKKIKNKDNSVKNHWQKNKTYKGIYRQTPVEGIRKQRGGPSVRPRKIRHIALMYSNLEYKSFNRGSRSDYPEGWWDDFDRHVEKSWKRQSKRRHQWKER